MHRPPSTFVWENTDIRGFGSRRRSSPKSFVTHVPDATSRVSRAATLLFSPAQRKRFRGFTKPDCRWKSFPELLPLWPPARTQGSRSPTVNWPRQSLWSPATRNRESPNRALDWGALARFPGTLVIYMGVTTAAIWTQALIQAGKSPDTPAALIRRCSHPDQQTVHCRLADVAERLTPASKMRPPVIVILGKVTELASTMNWIERRPLFGKTVLVTRPADQAESLASLLRDQGATVCLQPAIRIGPPKDWGPVDAAIGSLGSYDTVIFCSRNGVQYFLDRLLDRGGDMRGFGTAKIAVVGSQTAKSLADYRLRADVVPTDFRAESLAGQLASSVAGSRILIIRASRGRDVLENELTNAGAHVTQIVAYSNEDVDEPDAQILQLIHDGEIDWITVASSATAENLNAMFGSSLQNSRIASLSPVTSQTLGDLGIRVSAEANPYTMQGLVEAIVTKSC